MSAAAAPAQQMYMQGIAIPATAVNPEAFFAKTRRQILREDRIEYRAGLTQCQSELRKNGILSSLDIRFKGLLTVDPGAGSVSATPSWGPDLFTRIRYTANGAANLISVSGLGLKARHYMANDIMSDIGLTQQINGRDWNSGHFLSPSETYGVAPGQQNIPAGEYEVDFTLHVPISEDERTLTGASFLATSSSDLTLNIDFAQIADLFQVEGDATVDLVGSVDVTSTKFSIPIGADGQILVPDLSLFHSIIEANSSGLQNGTNEVRLVGQGSGKMLLRTWGQVLNGQPLTPLLLDDDVLSNIGWGYGGAERPEVYTAAGVHRHDIAEMYACDLGGPFGFMRHDFVNTWALRDAVDMGTTSDLRFMFDIAAGVELKGARFRYAVETLFSAGQAVG